MHKERAANVQSRQRDMLHVCTSSVNFHKPTCNRSCYGLVCLKYPTCPGSRIKFAKLLSDGGVETAEAASTSGFILHELLGILNALETWGSVRLWRRGSVGGSKVTRGEKRRLQEEKNGSAEGVGVGFRGDEKRRCGAGRP